MTGLRSVLMLALIAASGCKHADDGPRPFVFPAYPVPNLPPAQQAPPPPDLEQQPLRPVPMRNDVSPPR